MFKNLVITCFFGVLAITLGAFGAHALKEILTIDQLQSFETAVRYQMYHVVVLLFLNTYAGFSIKQKKVISYLFFAGIIFFSGSIYLIQLTFVTAKSIWFITPLGGLFFIIGWVLMMAIFLKKINKKEKIG
ncbi:MULTISPECIES: DUF423 domain-containing protein [unclassified Polaribacter]|uniref:DUF423 domain-containing protein n=1 Tax=unclassified Polaribacter TaxID=196858 RepID=UPI0011BD4A1E|nr:MULTISPECIES: DUF423 domain-containing protein [unclassified Polaribacter]TXD50917.1 DUF423 domain-containing protein [Polaribacter sp. IC063]TXD62290.1 DUF423 domain-containing protein [Polaribacter sp. IC066]